jgi:hypothetical protein
VGYRKQRCPRSGAAGPVTGCLASPHGRGWCQSFDDNTGWYEQQTDSRANWHLNVNAVGACGRGPLRLLPHRQPKKCFRFQPFQPSCAMPRWQPGAQLRSVPPAEPVALRQTYKVPQEVCSACCTPVQPNTALVPFGASVGCLQLPRFRLVRPTAGVGLPPRAHPLQRLLASPPVARLYTKRWIAPGRGSRLETHGHTITTCDASSTGSLSESARPTRPPGAVQRVDSLMSRDAMPVRAAQARVPCSC